MGCIDGTGRQVIDLLDDGLSGDGFAGDGVFGGSVSFGDAGTYRLGVTDGEFFERVTELTIFVDTLAVEAPAETIVIPGSSVEHLFTVTNLGGADRTFDLAMTSSAGWANLSGYPMELVVPAGDDAIASAMVAVPGDAANGDRSVLTLTAVAQDDPGIFGSASVATGAWNGPLLQMLQPSAATAGETLRLIGSGFGADPGAGNRDSNDNHVSVGGHRIPDANVVTWSDAEIHLVVPVDASGGLAFVVADGVASNSLPISVAVPEVTCDTNEDGGFDWRDIGRFARECRTASLYMAWCQNRKRWEGRWWYDRRCPAEEAPWLCDLNDDGRFNFGDTREYLQRCRSGN